VDESGFNLVSPLKRTWAPRGHTPFVRTSLQHHERLNAIGALVISPGGHQIKLRRQIYRRSLTGKEVIRFLQHLLRALRGPVVLVWDNAPIHRRQAVQAFLAQHPRLQVYNFPTYAPELNPVEFVWTQTNDYLAGRTPLRIGELLTTVRQAIARLRRSPAKLWACVYASDLPWQRSWVRNS
jgi:putative transposase